MPSDEVSRRRAYAFLFDGSVEGLPDPQLAYFTGEVLSALGSVDPSGRTHSQFRVGMPILSSFSQRTTGVRRFEQGIGRTVSHDTDTYKYVISEWIDSLDDGWHSIDREMGLEIFRLHTGECVAFSALDDEIRDSINRSLKSVPGYVGAFEIDPGNPVHRSGFFEKLIFAAAIENGAVMQELSYEGDADWPLDGSAAFQPNGTVWKPHGWLASSGPGGLPRSAVSKRGAKVSAGVAVKQAPNVEERVLKAIIGEFFTSTTCKTFDFKAIAEPTDILQAIMPEGKFTKYLFNRTHKEGGSKAVFFIDELGIDPQDWRYLAAQFYFGLLMAKPESVRLNEWDTGYGARFDVPMRIRNRAGQTATIVTGWNMNPGALPSLSTAFPGPRDAEMVEPGDPPILPPGPRADADWSKLWNWANTEGIRAGNSSIPTPMFITGFGPISEGEIGSAHVRVFDARRALARWLKQQGLGYRDSYGGTVVRSPIQSQSLDRANAWARTVASILRLNDIKVSVQSFYH